MKRITNILLIVFLLFPLLVLAQRKKTTSQKLNFSEVWVWEYTDSKGTKAEMVVYREPKLNYWLLTGEAYGQTDEMSLWFVLKPNGEVLQAYQDEESNSSKKMMKHRLYPDKKTVLPSNWKTTGNTKKFGDVSLGFPKFTGKEYKVSYGKTNEQSMFYLAATKADFSSLALFNDLDIDAKLPIRFPKDIPGNYIVLSEITKIQHNVISYSFKYISYSEFHINLLDYD
ncbi:MAG TPA: hypothetical protein PKX92_09985 [Edaphocola sp.]|nr:hypothetical protein [Edaphocola sp.]